MTDDIKYLKGDWDTRRFGKVPEMRMMKFRYGRYKNTSWAETLFKTVEDRKWFYDEFVPFIYNLSDCTGVRIHDNQEPSNDRIGWYLNDMIVGYIVEILIQQEIGFVFSSWNQTKSPYVVD